MSRVYTAESSIHGTGVLSSAQFSPGEIILRIDDSRVVTGADPVISFTAAPMPSVSWG
jgi:hypothetical protein